MSVTTGDQFLESADTEEDGYELLVAAEETIRNLGREETHRAYLKLYFLEPAAAVGCLHRAESEKDRKLTLPGKRMAMRIVASCAAFAAVVACGSGVASSQQYRWRCAMRPYPYENYGYDPAVAVTNLSNEPLAVNDVAVAVFSPNGAQVGSTDLGSENTGTAYVNPGSVMTFNWVPGDSTYPPSASADTCRVENLS